MIDGVLPIDLGIRRDGNAGRVDGQRACYLYRRDAEGKRMQGNN